MEIAKYIDHTLLSPMASRKQLMDLVQEAIKYNFYSVCVSPANVHFVKNKLIDSEVKITTVVGFPLGQATTETKVFEAKDAVLSGADEIDMVMNIAWLKDSRHDAVRTEISRVKEAIGDKVLKVIIETGLLTKIQIATAATLCVEGGADFVKTCTGFHKESFATIQDVVLIQKTVAGKAKVKASGGIRDFETLKLFLECNVDRIGASASVKIMEQAYEKGSSVSYTNATNVSDTDSSSDVNY